MYNTEFYKLLKKARYDNASMMIIVNKIIPLINKFSLKKDSNEIDEDLRSTLIEYTIILIKDDNFADKFAK